MTYHELLAEVAQRDVLAVPQPDAITLLDAEFDELAADILWFPSPWAVASDYVGGPIQQMHVLGINIRRFPCSQLT